MGMGPGIYHRGDQAGMEGGVLFTNNWKEKPPGREGNVEEVELEAYLFASGGKHVSGNTSQGPCGGNLEGGKPKGLSHLALIRNAQHRGRGKPNKTKVRATKCGVKMLVLKERGKRNGECGYKRKE